MANVSANVAVKAVNGSDGGVSAESPFLKAMGQHLEAGTLAAATSYLEAHPAEVATHSMELIDAVMIRLVDQAGDERLLDGCVALLSAIARLANRKEALICLLEKGEMFKEDACFKALLPPLQIVLCREPTKRGSSLAWALSTLYTHLASVPLPRQHALEGRERLLMYQDPDVRRHTDLLHALTPFFKPFVEEISPLHSAAACTPAGVRARELLCCYLLKVLDRPLAFLDLTPCGECVPEVRQSADQLMLYTTALQSNPLRLFALLPAAKCAPADGQTDEEQFDESGLDWRQELRVSSLALGTYMYLLCAEQVALESTPAVLCPAYVTRISLPLCVALLRRRELSAVHKGALLLRALLGRLPRGQLPASQVDAPAHADVTALLINMSVFSSLPELRKLCIGLLTDYVWRFDAHGRFVVLRNLLNSNHNPSVLGFVTGLLKESMAEALACERRCPWFSAPSVTPLLRTACRLQNGPTTDLLENHNHVMAALNLMRFVLLRDKADVCGLRARAEELRTVFLSPLRTALDLSRGHFRLRARELSERGQPAPPSTEVELNVGGQTLAGLPPEQQRQTVELALTTLDLIGTVLGWVGESLGAGQRAGDSVTAGQRVADAPRHGDAGS
ncbi:Glomulin [Amphibalanus amphitrite]|uniref:Glomulin n=1 Tax=Amphibalanus amphitrite TaxID=1232801 RepID=A0A6A4WFA2_AMPAM|nr:glomulin-like [Amphibalanus amphitrite]XP_043234273.1 glomulin-like [Amphibalanus amphitrite]KAF0304673.1 Glomulin [Amphibalanus amphitrite]